MNPRRPRKLPAHQAHQNRLYEAVRLLLTTDASDRAIAGTTLSKTTVGAYRKRVKQLGLVWKGQVDTLSPDALAKLLVAQRSNQGKRTDQPDWDALLEDARHSGVSVLQLRQEYAAQASNPMSYTRFAAEFKRRRCDRSVVMRQDYRPGEQVMVDYSGKTIAYLDPNTGQPVTVQVLVMVCPFSSLIFATATRTQSKADFLMGCARGLAYFGGVPQLIVTDNLKSAVTRSGYEPQLQRDFMEFLAYHNAVCRPARVRRPRDKAAVENAVRLVKHGILLALRHEHHRSLDEVNAAIAEKLDHLNRRVMKKYGHSRWARFDAHERAALQPLPDTPYEYADWVHVPKVPNDYHVRVEDHFYSVPYTVVGETVEVRLTHDRVQVHHHSKVVADHPRSTVKGGDTTVRAHQPPHHQARANETAGGALVWAEQVGPLTRQWLQDEFDRHSNPFKAMEVWRSLKVIAFKHGAIRLERAVSEAKATKALNLTAVRRLVVEPSVRSRALRPVERAASRSRPLRPGPTAAPAPFTPMSRGPESRCLH